MARLAALLLAAALVCGAQSISREEEERLLREALGSSAGGAADFIRIVEEHLRKHPDSPRRAQIEAAILRAAVDSKDHERVIRYGWKAFESGSADPAMLEEIVRALLARPGAENASRALKVAQGLEKHMRERPIEGESPRERARMQEDSDAGLARALLYQARALGALGKTEEAVALARRSFEARPSGEAAREAARWSERAGKIEDALRALADAFVLTDPPQPEALRAQDRARMRELFTKLRGTEKGLGDLVLEAYDRGARRAAEREARLRSVDPNARVSDPLDFTLSALEGEPLRLATLRGKVIVMDFWATWCGPCRTQKPLYDEVKKRFAKRSDVVFLAVNADEDRSRVAPFVEAERWGRNIHFEDGLAGALRISSIPTTVVFGKDGQVFARFNGFVPDRFVEMLTERIEAALQQPAQ